MSTSFAIPKVIVPYPKVHKPEWIADDRKPLPQFAKEHHIDVNHETICSIAPIRLAHEIRLPGGVYEIPAVPKGEYRCLRIHDTIDVVQDRELLSSVKHTSELAGKSLYEERPIPCKDRLFDILGNYRSTMYVRAQVTWGIRQIKGDHPTEEEWEKMVGEQVAFCTWLVNDADQLASQRKYNDIMPLHRSALHWIGDYDPARHDWAQEVKATQNKRCPNCSKMILFEAVGCEHCGANIITKYVELNDMGFPIDISAEYLPIQTAVKKMIAERSARKN